VLAELKRLAEVGTILTTGFGLTHAFECECGRTIQRRSALLKNEQVINCIGVNCDESFSVLIENGEICFARRVLRLACNNCGDELAVPTRVAEKLKRNQMLTAQCLKCGAKNNMVWRLIRQNEQQA
jgi:transcription elongation factor Elf1